MVRTTFSSREVIKALTKHGFVPVGGKGSHTTLEYKDPNTGKIRTVTVPQGSLTAPEIAAILDERELPVTYETTSSVGPE
jgi:YcfA-like protein.